ncbi:MAG: thiol-disulfide isomerase, partial [Planctomycetes bacterium]|nr:thiol-disulfide isomerase [Planctomycetota bacterium]
MRIGMLSRSVCRLANIVVGFVAGVTLSSTFVDAAELGEKVSNFTLHSYRGSDVSLDDFADQKLVAVAFLGTECPLAKLYGPRL